MPGGLGFGVVVMALYDYIPRRLSSGPILGGVWAAFLLWWMLGELGEDVADGFGAEGCGNVAVFGACGDVEHVAGSGFDGVGVEAVLDAAFEDEDAVAGFAPVVVVMTGRWGAFLVAERDAERGDGFANVEAGCLDERVVGGLEEVGALHGGSVAWGS